MLFAKEEASKRAIAEHLRDQPEMLDFFDTIAMIIQVWDYVVPESHRINLAYEPVTKTPDEKMSWYRKFVVTLREQYIYMTDPDITRYRPGNLKQLLVKYSWIAQLHAQKEGVGNPALLEATRWESILRDLQGLEPDPE